MKYIVFIGNDCTGKSSIVKLINRKSDELNMYALERSTEPSDIIHKKIKESIDIKSIDNLTLISTVKEQYYKYELLEKELEKEIYYIVLDSDIDVLLKRIDVRMKNDPSSVGMFETKKALEYFKQRYLALAHYHGIPVVTNNGEKDLDELIEEIKNIIDTNIYTDIKEMSLKKLDRSSILSKCIEKSELYNLNLNIDEDKIKDKYFQYEFLKNVYNSISEEKQKEFIKKSRQREYVNNLSIEEISSKISGPVLRLVSEGESKKVYEIISKINSKKYLDYYVIELKPTIYSHSKQACGEIKDLEKIRASGTQLILEMLWRNNILHTYYGMNNCGISHSRIIETTPCELVFKKYCIGTDKHQYHMMTKNTKCVNEETGEYLNGPYVRFDWRNPNQISVEGIQLNQMSYYYIMEEILGKESFFDNYLKKEKSMGDKAVSEDILENMFNTTECKRIILKIYSTVQYYCSKVGLEVRDGCFMIDSQNKYIWSEINPDCMRIISKNGGSLYDKDIWRQQTSGTKDHIVKQWKSFNDIFEKYFDSNEYIKNELSMSEINNYKYYITMREILNNQKLKISPKYKYLYESLLPKIRKEVVFTIDMYDNKPVLVQKGKIMEIHSDGDVNKAIEKINISNNILVVDLNGAIDDNIIINRKIIKDLATKYHTMNGGGIRKIEDVQDILSASSRKIVISTNLDEKFISLIPKERLIIELSVNEHNKIMKNGRNITTDIDVIDEIKRLIKLGVYTISITFHNSEGMLNGLPRTQINNMISQIPIEIEKIYIAGGISSLDDLEFLWSFNRIIPQLGSAIWKNKITMGQVISSMGKYDQYGIIPAIIQDETGKILGLVYMNNEAIKNCVDKRELWRYSRQLNRLIKKGESSDNTQNIVHMTYDCDNDSILVTVGSDKPFCHLKRQNGRNSCFNVQMNKFNTGTIYKWVEKSNSKYLELMKKYPGYSYSKLLEEISELWAAKEVGKEFLITESSDVYVHFLMFIKSLGISMESIMNELGRRHYNPKLLITETHKIYNEKHNTNYVIGITGEKYASYTDNFIFDVFGIKINRGFGKNLHISYEIINKDKYYSMFTDKIISFVGLKPKDMTMAVIYKLLNAVVSYNTVLDNLPTVFNIIETRSENDIKLCLIKRKDKNIDLHKWSPINKGIIACEHMTTVTKYMTNIGIKPDCYSLHKFSGSSESFLVNDTCNNYDLCDAVVSTGKTLDENNLEIFDTMIESPDVQIVFAETIAV